MPCNLTECETYGLGIQMILMKKGEWRRKLPYIMQLMKQSILAHKELS